MKRKPIAALLISALLLTVGCAKAPSPVTQKNSNEDGLVGAWRAKVQFKSGAFAAVKNIEFMYAFNSGGTMTESSNYDASPPVPPAYGVWRMVRPGQYEAKYSFFLTKPPKAFEEITGGGGWMPGGSGVLDETITLSTDGKSFTSMIRLDLFDEAGKLIETNSEAEAQAVRIEF